MRNIRTIFNRELLAYFNSPIAYIFLIVFALVNCGLYMTTFFLSGVLEMRTLLGMLPLILIVFIPAITMRSWAEERRTGTIELLLTFPMKKSSVILGKFLAGLVFLLISLASTWTVPALLALLGSPDYGQILSGYLGAAFLGALFLAVGMFISGLFKDQISAFILSVVTAFMFYLMGTEFMATFIDGWLPGVGTFFKNYIGTTQHFDSFQKGVIQFSDIYYFSGFTALFLILNNFTLNVQTHQFRKGSLAAFSGLIVAIFIFSMMIVTDFVSVRFDATRGKIHTISPATKKILRDLKVPVTIFFYVTNAAKMPTGMKNLRRDVLEKLAELKIHSDNHVRIEVIDPSGNEELAKELAGRGIRPFQVQSIEADSLGIKLVYATIVLSYLDKRDELIDQIHPQRLGNLEYDLISKIHRLTLDKQPHVSIAAPYQDMDPQMIQLMRQMGQNPPEQQDNYDFTAKILRQENYIVSRIKLEESQPIPGDADTLVVLGIEKLNSRQLYEIDQWVGRGKNLILAEQNHTYQYGPSPTGAIEILPQKAEEQLQALTTHWGVTWNPDIYFDPSHEILSIPTQQDIGGFFTATVEIPIKAPIQVKVLPENMNKDISITSSLGPLLYMWGSPLILDQKTIDSLSLKSTSLFTGSKGSWMIKDKPTPLNENDLKPENHSKLDHPVLGVLLEGKFPKLYSYLEEAPSWDSTEPIEAKPEPGQTQAQVIILGCAEMFNNNLLRAHSNGSLFLNMVDALTLGEDLISIRGKELSTQYIRPVEKFEKMIYRATVPLFMPIFWALFGIIFLALKKKSRETYYALFVAAKIENKKSELAQ